MKEVEFTGCPELRLQTDDEIIDFIVGGLSRMSAAQFQTVVKKTYPIEKGGGAGAGAGIDPDIEVLMEALDTIHDFYDDHAKATSPLVMNALRPFTIPSGLKDHELSDEWAVIHFLSHAKTLAFKQKRQRRIVVNPVFGLGLETLYKYPNYDANIQSLWKRQVASLHNHIATGAPFIHVDLHTFAGANNVGPRSLRFASLLEVCWAIHRHFGAAVAFAADSGNHPIIKLVVRVFKIRSLLEVGFRKSVHWAGLVEALKARVGEEGGENAWTLVSSDANVFDVPEIDRESVFDGRPTGYVNQSVTLGGGGSGKIAVSLGGERGSRELTKAECKEFSRRESVSAHINMDLRDRGNFSPTQWLDFKRAGDLGQVMNAKRYGRIPITNDKYMAMMAYMHRVPFILMRERQPIHKESVVRNITTFTLYRP